MIKKSPWLYHIATGGCNGCDIEILAAITPRFDAERLGCVLKGSPRHADILVVTGCVTNKMKGRLLRIYSQMSRKRIVIGIGICTTSGGFFKNAPNRACLGCSLEKFLPVDIYVQGCPPRPQAILYGIKKALEMLK
ncbi:MAG: NADH-quinone oxidoreductase subunit B family protein [Candidatus Aenigmatarchaeota archaeon]